MIADDAVYVCFGLRLFNRTKAVDVHFGLSWWCCECPFWFELMVLRMSILVWADGAANVHFGLSWWCCECPFWFELMVLRMSILVWVMMILWMSVLVWADGAVDVHFGLSDDAVAGPQRWMSILVWDYLTGPQTTLTVWAIPLLTRPRNCSVGLVMRAVHSKMHLWSGWDSSGWSCCTPSSG